MITLVSLIMIPITVISTQKGPSVETKVESTGGNIAVETNVESSSQSKIEVNESGQTVLNNDGSTGSYSVVVKDNDQTVFATSGSALGEQEAAVESIPDFETKEITIAEYISEEIQKLFDKILQRLSI